jgi:hypothetical protein
MPVFNPIIIGRNAGITNNILEILSPADFVDPESDVSDPDPDVSNFSDISDSVIFGFSDNSDIADISDFPDPPPEQNGNPDSDLSRVFATDLSLIIRPSQGQDQYSFDDIRELFMNRARHQINNSPTNNANSSQN